ncbi:hypothetical protein M8494_37180 [Serratia ureilytica]
MAFSRHLVLSGIDRAGLYNLQVLRVEDYRTRSNENRISWCPSRPAAALSIATASLALNCTIYQLELMPGEG